MSAWRKHSGAAALALGLALSVSIAAEAAERLNLGRVATPEEIAGWDIDVRPDGQGLPPGSGDPASGEEVYLERCAACHGEFGEAVGRYPVLIGGEDTLAEEDPVKTVGSYWPYASTLYDYIYRAMPFGEAQTLTADETYGLVAFLLNQNGIVEDDQVVDQSNLAAIEMPNAGGFLLPDPRPDTAVGEPCMTDCRDEPSVAGRAKRLDVTPKDEETQ